MRREGSTKIVATLGPASDTKEHIRALVQAGADVFRFNFSHGEHADHARRLDALREIEDELDRPVGALMDLQGPKLRIGTLAEGPVRLEPGHRFRLDLDPTPGDLERVQLPHREVFDSVERGTELLLDDGKLRLRVEHSGGDYLETSVQVGGVLRDRKGVNVPSAMLQMSPLTPKDRNDLRFGLDQGFDWVALSFVQRPEDVAEARRLVAGRAALMAKIERPTAVDHLDAIIELADGIMIARGDLGVELPPEDVPGLQKRMVRAARAAGKPVVVATQMLESMLTAPAPTRAEASDVATACYDGADALMLSGESAAGAYPIEAVGIMDRIINRVERDPLYRSYVTAYAAEAEHTAEDAITQAAASVARTLNAACIVTYTTSGATALRAARKRPDQPILGLITRLGTARRLSVVWAVRAIVCHDARDLDDMIAKARATAVRAGMASAGQALVVTAGLPFGTPGATNMLRIAYVTERDG
ncbi:MAG: pyruvate kinase [Alphaproteobacteria bacterium]|jgi:pyruvate kinase|nr:pyruvate kinase [Alphaproteobacteria bacterium]